jgi:hypothetical protein
LHAKVAEGSRTHKQQPQRHAQEQDSGLQANQTLDAAVQLQLVRTLST